MDTTRIHENRKATEESKVPEGIAGRIRRGITDHAERGHEIVRVGEGVCLVPSSSKDRRYRGTIPEDGNLCQCIDKAKANLPLCRHGVSAMIEESKHPLYVAIGKGREHPELSVPANCRYFSDCYSTPTYRVMEFRCGEFVRLHGECYLGEADALVGELSGERRAA